MYKQILVTLDGSRLSEAVLPEVTRLAAGSGAHVLVATVVEAPPGTLRYPEVNPLVAAGAPAPGGVAHLNPAPRAETKGQAIEHARDEAKTYLDRKTKDMREQGIDVETVALFGEPVEEILSYAAAHDVDLIMMATHGRTGLVQVLFGSVAARIVGTAKRPVLLVRPASLGSAPST